MFFIFRGQPLHRDNYIIYRRAGPMGFISCIFSYLCEGLGAGNAVINYSLPAGWELAHFLKESLLKAGGPRGGSAMIIN